MKTALGLVLSATLLLAPACSRDKDPYRDWKAPQFLDEGERLLRLNDLPTAYIVFKRGLEKVESSGARPEQARIFLARMLYIAAAQGNRVELEKMFTRMGGSANPQTMDVRITLHLVILLQREGKAAEARALAEKLALRLEARPAEFDETPFYAVGWIVIDRLRTANVEIAHSREASDAFVATFTEIATTAISGRQLLLPGLRTWITPYVDHLFDNDRGLVAQQIADLVERIDEVAPPSDDKAPCLVLDRNFPALGCLADWPAK